MTNMTPNEVAREVEIGVFKFLHSHGLLESDANSLTMQTQRERKVLQLTGEELCTFVRNRNKRIRSIQYQKSDIPWYSHVNTVL